MQKPTELAEQNQTADAPEPMAGRKGLPAALRKSIMLRVLVTKDQRRDLEKAARKAGMELSTWIRTVALEAAQRGPGRS